jgi:hypothetical protein
MASGRSRLLGDPGTYWHTATGRLICSTGRLPHADPYSFTFGGEPWVAYEWLAECAMAAVHDGIAGLDSLLLATVTVLASLFAWVAHRLLRSGLHWMPTALLVVLAIAVGAGHLLVRPHIATIVFLGVTFAVLCDVEAGRTGLGRLFWVVPLFIVWTNAHGGVLGGLATLALVVAGWFVLALFGKSSPASGPRPALVLGLLILGCGLSILANPYGLALPRTWLRIMESPVPPRLIIEHGPAELGGSQFVLICAVGVVYGLTLAGTWPRQPRITWLIPLVWLGLALARVRHAPLLGIMAILAMAEILPYSRVARWLARSGRDLYRFPDFTAGCAVRCAWRPMVVPALVVALAILLQTAGARVPLLGQGWAKLDPQIWPIELLPQLRLCEQAHSRGARIFNDYRFGGFLIYFTPGLKVFVDDRFEVYGDRWLLNFAEARQNHPEWVESWARQYQIGLALVETGSPFDQYLESAPGWVVLGHSEPATLYRRLEREQKP